MPAKVDGTWKLAQGELTLKQTFQNVAGTLRTGGRTVPIDGRLRGDQISFKAGDAEYSGKVSADSIEGTVRGASSGRWSASRVGKPVAAVSK